jgi:hypothetical protein
VWLRLLSKKSTVLIDMPDYSKTDARGMARDLGEVYWLWNSLNRLNQEPRPNLVISIQKEMFRGHFFLDKMEKVELLPLQPNLMVQAYRGRFKTLKPFTEDALLTLAGMSRGIFRRYLRYITLALNLTESQSGGKVESDIDVALVKEAVGSQRLAADMELELLGIFPRENDLRILAVRLLMLLEEQGPQKQSTLGASLEVAPYVLSRLLGKLEASRYVMRTREGGDKLVALRSST